MRLNLVFVSLMLVVTLLVSSCGGSGGRFIINDNWLPLVQYAVTGQIDLFVDNAGFGGWFNGAESIGVEDESTGAAVIMYPNTYVTTGGFAPTWVNIGIAQLDAVPANSRVAGFTPVGGAKVIVETSLGLANTVFSRNLTVVLPLGVSLANGTGVTVFFWNGSSWQNLATVSQAGNAIVSNNTVTIGVNRGGNYLVCTSHGTGGGGGQ